MREYCLNCTRKHLANAEILMDEFATGDYPGYDWLAMAHMNQAESEVMAIYPQRAKDIRSYRKKYEEDRSFRVPILDLINAITEEFENLTIEEQEDATIDSRKKIKKTEKKK